MCVYMPDAYDKEAATEVCLVWIVALPYRHHLVTTIYNFDTDDESLSRRTRLERYWREVEPLYCNRWVAFTPPEFTE